MLLSIIGLVSQFGTTDISAALSEIIFCNTFPMHKNGGMPRNIKCIHHFSFWSDRYAKRQGKCTYIFDANKSTDR